MSELSKADLDALVAHATGRLLPRRRGAGGFAVLLEENLAVPFETTVLGVTVTVRKIDRTESGIVAICVRGKTGRLSLSSACRCQIRLFGTPNGSPRTAAGRDRQRYR